MAYDGEIVSINLVVIQNSTILGTVAGMRKRLLYQTYKIFGLPKRSTKRKEVVKNDKQ